MVDVDIVFIWDFKNRIWFFFSNGRNYGCILEDDRFFIFGIKESNVFKVFFIKSFIFLFIGKSVVVEFYFIGFIGGIDLFCFFDG